MNKGRKFTEVFQTQEEFEFEFSAVHTDPRMIAHVLCPTCGKDVLLNKYRGFDEGPYGWCRNCDIAVQD